MMISVPSDPIITNCHYSNTLFENYNLEINSLGFISGHSAFRILWSFQLTPAAVSVSRTISPLPRASK